MEQKYYQALKDIEEMKERFAVLPYVFYYGKTFKHFIQKVKASANSLERTQINIIIEDIKDEEKCEVLNSMKEEINSGLVNITFKMAVNGSLVLVIDAANTIMTLEDRFRQELKLYLNKSLELAGLQSYIDKVLHVVLVLDKDDFEFRSIFEEKEFLSADFDAHVLHKSSLCLELEANAELFDTEETLQSQITQLVQNVVSCNGNNNNMLQANARLESGMKHSRFAISSPEKCSEIEVLETTVQTTERAQFNTIEGFESLEETYLKTEANVLETTAQISEHGQFNTLDDEGFVTLETNQNLGVDVWETTAQTSYHGNFNTIKEKTNLVKTASKAVMGTYERRARNQFAEAMSDINSDTVVSRGTSGNDLPRVDKIEPTDSLPSFAVQPKNVTVEMGDSFVLECEVLSKYPVIYEWYYNHNLIKRSDQSFYEVKAVNKAHIGTYECRAKNKFGETISDIFNVTVVPFGTSENEIEIISNPKTIIIEFGSDCQFSCAALCNKPLVYQWLKDGVPLEGEIKPDFVLKKVQSYDHQGLYNCMVSIPDTEYFKLSYPASLSMKIKDKPEFNNYDFEDIEILSNPQTVLVELGSDCMLSCKASCKKPLVYQWLKDGVPLKGKIQPDFVLKEVKSYEHQGLYTCMVSIPGTKYLKLSYPASLSIKTKDKPEFNPSDKVAMLIGNFEYRCESPLSSPKSDVYTMAEIFRSLDFKVVSLLNLTKIEMLSAVEEFVKLIGSEVYAVFYFCGHGFEEEGKCYLVPPDARHDYTIEDCVCAEDVLNQMQNYTEPALIVLILDINRTRNLSPSHHHMSPGLSNFKARGNTVFCYATSKGMYAYEDMHSGILVTYLKKYLPTQMSVIQVFTSVQEDIGKSTHYQIQIPEIKSNLLQPRRSLSDRISIKGHKMAYNKRTDIWNNAHEKPKAEELLIPKLGAKVLLEFQTEFSNMLTVFCTVTSSTGKSFKDYLGCIGNLPKTISIYGSVTLVHDDPPTTKIVLQDLQKLTNPLEVKVFVVDVKTKEKYDGPKLNLGKPLVGILDLWRPRSQPTECSDEL